jgi:hypothetical protein
MFTSFVAFGALVSRDLLGVFGKWLALLNDRVVFHTPTSDLLRGAMPRAADAAGISRDVVEQLLGVWQPVGDFVQGYRFLGDPWQTSVPGLSDAAHRAAHRHAMRELGLTEEQSVPREDRRGYARELGLVGAGLVESIGLWLTLNQAFSCSFVGDEIEHEALDGVLRISGPTRRLQAPADELTLALPDIHEVPWNTILELRQKPFLAEFRGKLSELDDILQTDDQRSARELLREVELQDLRALAVATKPSPALSTLKAIVGNIPLPIPVNPASLGISIADTVAARKLKARFGWLYFLFELQSAESSARTINR